MQSVVRNHPLVDGNKRLGWHAATTFLDLNGHRVELDDDQAFDLVMDAASNKLEVDEIAARLVVWVGTRGRRADRIHCGLIATTYSATSGPAKPRRATSPP